MVDFFEMVKKIGSQAYDIIGNPERSGGTN
jgi:hypothetical protein